MQHTSMTAMLFFLKQTVLYLPWNLSWVWKFVSKACFPQAGTECWKTTTTPLVWTVAWAWQNMKLIYIVPPPRCHFQFESYLGLIWKLLLSASWKQMVCSWESKVEELEWMGGGRVGRSLLWNAMFRLIRRKQALTNQEMKWQMAHISPPAFRWALLAWRHQDSSFCSDGANSKQRSSISKTLSACDGWVVCCHEVLSFSDLQITPNCSHPPSLISPPPLSVSWVESVSVTWEKRIYVRTTDQTSLTYDDINGSNLRSVQNIQGRDFFAYLT